MQRSWLGEKGRGGGNGGHRRRPLSRHSCLGAATRRQAAAVQGRAVGPRPRLRSLHLRLETLSSSLPYGCSYGCRVLPPPGRSVPFSTACSGSQQVPPVMGPPDAPAWLSGPGLALALRLLPTPRSPGLLLASPEHRPQSPLTGEEPRLRGDLRVPVALLALSGIGLPHPGRNADLSGFGFFFG